MRAGRIPDPGLLVAGVLYNSQEALSEAETEIQRIFGPILEKTVPVPFGRFTDYYQKEMGGDISKTYWAFSEPFLRGKLVEAKLSANRIERKLCVGEKRRVNLDPGLLTPESLVLASSKPYSHRVYICKGIYCEVTLIFRRNGMVEFLPWTYPDYRDPVAVDFFGLIRKEVLLG